MSGSPTYHVNSEEICRLVREAISDSMPAILNAVLARVQGTGPPLHSEPSRQTESLQPPEDTGPSRQSPSPGTSTSLMPSSKKSASKKPAVVNFTMTVKVPGQLGFQKLRRLTDFGARNRLGSSGKWPFSDVRDVTFRGNIMELFFRNEASLKRAEDEFSTLPRLLRLEGVPISMVPKLYYIHVGDVNWTKEWIRNNDDLAYEWSLLTDVVISKVFHSLLDLYVVVDRLSDARHLCDWAFPMTIGDWGFETYNKPVDPRSLLDICHNCCEPGHFASQCPNPAICCICLGSHPWLECTATGLGYKCPNCMKRRGNSQDPTLNIDHCPWGSQCKNPETLAMMAARQEYKTKPNWGKGTFPNEIWKPGKSTRLPPLDLDDIDTSDSDCCTGSPSQPKQPPKRAYREEGHAGKTSDQTQLRLKKRWPPEFVPKSSAGSATMLDMNTMGGPTTPIQVEESQATPALSMDSTEDVTTPIQVQSPASSAASGEGSSQRTAMAAAWASLMPSTARGPPLGPRGGVGSAIPAKRGRPRGRGRGTAFRH
ncbi:hypothetical protein CLIM01_12830 [Colletotrichum limetticola]|uniref:CCHC-type domain-containing protein n=1 Tax=Colletotrichum limetticola TaxID=1209924 RepID=A0ABQ9PDL7_9PEZI|nr:hypothetical protein CLIM01_12830 [Colletotrichum limetticola]